MVGERLHTFDLDLCDYVLGQIRPHLRSLPERLRRPLSKLDYDGFHRLSLTEWLGRGVATLPDALADHIWAGVIGEGVVLPLNDAELFDLAALVDDPPMRCEDECVWVPYSALHRQYVECIPEIQRALATATAEEWATDALRFGAKLCEERLPLIMGVSTVHEWVWCARRLLQAMNATSYLPAPIGYHSTPTMPKTVAAAAKRGMTRRNKPIGIETIETVVQTSARSDGAATMLSPAQIALMFSISLSTVYAACRSGMLAHYRVPATRGKKGKYLIREVDALSWLESLRVAPNSTTPSPSAPASLDSQGEPFSVLDPERLVKAWKHH